MTQRRLFAVVLVVSSLALGLGLQSATAAPTDGWTQASWTYSIHKPYNLSVSARFKYSSGVWYTWVYKTDEPLSSGSGTDPRCEMRWNNNYTSGQRMWDGDVYWVSPSNSASIAQVFGGSSSSTASMIFGFSASSGTLKRYSSNTLVTGINNKWTNLKLAHDANNNNVRIYINNSLKRTDPDRGNATHYFKNGVYAQIDHGSSSRMECRFRNLKQWQR